MKKEYVFPEKWKILITKENFDIITPYYAEVSDTYTTRHQAINEWIQSHNFSNQIPVKGAGCSFFGNNDDDDEFTKITVEEFQKYVLNKECKIEELEDVSYLIKFMKDKEVI